MEWTERLNRELGRMPLGSGTVEVLQWAYARNLADNRPHRHTFFEVCQVGAYGRGKFIVQGQPNSIEPGDLFVARPGVIHQIVNTSEPNMELRWVSFQWTPPEKPQAIEQTKSEADALFRAFSDSSVVTVRSAAVAALWGALEAAAGEPLGLAGEEQHRLLATALLLGIGQAGAERLDVPEAAASEPSDLPARLAVRFIHDNLSRPLPLPEIAAQVHLSPRHLSRVLRKFTGKAPAHYITHARMDRARGLLLRSALPLKEIAATVGYPDIHHFTRVFTAHFGSPPGEVRRRPELCPVLNIQNPGDLV
jgi:AraC-like DNA-binding protein/mannose-6-phosphate isomerase-like protein (cupin superfamily)